MTWVTGAEAYDFYRKGDVEVAFPSLLCLLNYRSHMKPRIFKSNISHRLSLIMLLNNLINPIGSGSVDLSPLITPRPLIRDTSREMPKQENVFLGLALCQIYLPTIDDTARKFRKLHRIFEFLFWNFVSSGRMPSVNWFSLPCMMSSR